MRLFEYFGKVVLIVAGVLLLMVVRDIVKPQTYIKIEDEPHFIIYPDHEGIEEVAFNLGIDPLEVTEEQFNNRYNK